MREIKFRAWDAERKTMRRSVGFSDSDCGRRWQRETYMVDDGSDFSSSNWIPMQFTGLKDKNGKEIYEDDIITYERSGNKVQRRVQWHYTVSGYPMLSYNPFDIEVIGNIYENPDLLIQ
jgi:uncharacterized phage protein (TIGR01671 family)